MNFHGLVANIRAVDQGARSSAARSIDRVLTLRNWLIGAYVVEYEQNGEDRAAYGDRMITELAKRLRKDGCRGLGVSNIKNCRQLALTWPGLEIRQTLSGVFASLLQGNKSGKNDSVASASSKDSDLIRQKASGESSPSDPNVSGFVVGRELSFPSLAERAAQSRTLEWQDPAWYERLFSSLSFSHLLELSRIDDPLRRAFYELECLRSGWSIRELRRQMDSMLYERVGLSKDKAAVIAMAEKGVLVDSPSTVIRDPYILEFIGVEEAAEWSESDLEQALLDHLQQFIHELGRDFCFMDRQHRITVGGRHHFIDLVFFHRSLRAVIAIDLKLGAFRHEYAGQMNFYLNYISENLSHPDENPPVGIVLCADKNAAEVHYATAGLEHEVFVSRYLVRLPSEDQLKKWLEEERFLLDRSSSETRRKDK
ncbi:MAG: DUF1016 family protein [Deltaproteobacteria bacterium]|nr:DUF1016 family protein [Deltaproteobacteria bacterium]